jgi:hypothetical protein
MHDCQRIRWWWSPGDAKEACCSAIVLVLYCTVCVRTSGTFFHHRHETILTNPGAQVQKKTTKNDKQKKKKKNIASDNRRGNHGVARVTHCNGHKAPLSDLLYCFDVPLSRDAGGCGWPGTQAKPPRFIDQRDAICGHETVAVRRPTNDLTYLT